MRAGSAGLEPGGEKNNDADNIDMVIEVVEKEPGQVNLKDNSGPETRSLNIPLADSSDVASRVLDNLIAWNADFIAFD